MKISKTSNEGTILLFDKKGDLGNALAISLGSEIKIVLVSGKELIRQADGDNLLHLSVKKGRVPQMPDVAYSWVVVFYNGEEDVREHMHKFIKKAEEDRSKLLLITDIPHANEASVRNFSRFNKKAYVVVTGEIFGKEIWDGSSLTDSILYQASVLSGIKIPRMGMDRVYPVFLEDALAKINKILFYEDIKPGLYFLFSKAPVTLLSFARMIKKINPLVNIDFVKAPKQGREELVMNEIPLGGEYLLPAGYRLEERIRASGLLDETEDKNRGILLKEEAGFRLEKKEHKNRLQYGILLFVLLIVLMPVLALFVSFFIGGYFASSAEKSLENGNIKNALSASALSASAFSVAQKALNASDLELSVIGYSQKLNEIDQLTLLGQKASFVIGSLAASYEKAEKVFKGDDTNYKSDFTSAANRIKQAMLVLEDLKTDQNGHLAKPLKSLNNYNMIFGLAASLSDNAGEIFGIDSKKTYLILFQNNMELRPGGGFIGSYGLLSFNKGKIVNFSVHDVYDADGQLKGHVEPPFPIRRFLANPNWYLRDSNFDVDFTRDASSSAFFLNQETGVIVDGVAAVDVSFIKNLLTATGPIFVADYNQNVTSGNVFELTEEHAEKNFFPGSTQKKDFLRSLLSAMQAKLSGKVNYPSMLEAINNSIKEKHVLFAFSDPNLQNIFTANGVSSSLWDDRQTDSAVINDFVGVNEANLGADKDNFFLKRSIKEQVSIDGSGKLSNEINVHYDNAQALAGDYKVYVRFILPLGSLVNSVIIDGVKQEVVPAVTDPGIYEAKGFIAPKGLETETYDEENKTIFGFYVIVPAGQSKTVTVEAENPKRVDLDSGFFTYDLKVFKQPGTDSDPFSLKIAYPSGFRVFNSNYKLQNSGGLAELSTALGTDKDYTIEFSKK